MDILKQRAAVVKISAAVFVPCGKGGAIHKNRQTHGIAYNYECETTYRFATGEVIVCRSGEAIYLPQSSDYTVDKKEIATADNSGTYAINFLTEPSDLELAPQKVAVRGRDEMLSLFKKAVLAWKKKNEAYYEECFCDLYRVLKLLNKESSEYTRHGKNISLLAPALEYIYANYTVQNITIGKLAELCGISEPYLRRLFSKSFSVSPSVYIRNMRIKYAAELLVTGEYSVTEAAVLSGFSDTAYFSREFKKVMGVSQKSY